MASAAPAAEEDELTEMMQRLMESLAQISHRLPFPLNPQRVRSVVSLAALAIAVVFAWKLLRPSTRSQRRRWAQPGASTSHSSSSSQTNMMVHASEACSSSVESRAQDLVDDFFQPVKLTLGQLVRQKLCEGRKVTCRLLGVILEETSPEELLKHATVRSSVLEVLLEITKLCDLYLMERILDDESGERVISALSDAGLFTSSGLISDKVLFCSTENGRSSFVRQLEPDWHIDTNPDIIFQLARFIKYQLYITPNRPERAASNVFSSTSLEQFIGVPDRG